MTYCGIFRVRKMIFPVDIHIRVSGTMMAIDATTRFRAVPGVVIDPFSDCGQLLAAAADGRTYSELGNMFRETAGMQWAVSEVREQHARILGNLDTMIREAQRAGHLEVVE